MRPFALMLALVLGSSSMAQEPRPEPSTTARVVKGLDWMAVSLLSAGLVLQSAALLSSTGRPGLEDPLYTAFVLSFVGGMMTGIVSTLIKAVTKLTSPGVDVPGPYSLVMAPSRTGRLLQTTGVVVTFVGMVVLGVGNALAWALRSGPASPRAGTWLQVGGGLTTAVGMMSAMIGGELREGPAVAVLPVSGGAVVGLSSTW
jgi:hypothetical protein